MKEDPKPGVDHRTDSLALLFQIFRNGREVIYTYQQQTTYRVKMVQRHTGLVSKFSTPLSICREYMKGR